ncbi:UNVERIFIED_ORG: ABC-type transporter Mla subunit MlaD [Microbispora rosea subsp. rosea]
MEHSSHNLLQAGSQTAISDRMRELLARAAQDHVYEQRTQGAVLDEIRQRLEGMEWLLREVRERELGGLGVTLEVITQRLDDMTVRPPAWAEGLAQHMELLRDHVDDVGGRTQGLADRMADVAHRLGKFQGSMEAAAGRFTRIDKALAALTERTERLEAVVVERLDSVGGRIEAVESGVEGMDARVTALGAGVGDVAAGVDEMSTTIAGMNADLTLAAGAVVPLADAVRSRPDREQIAETVSDAVTRAMEPARGDVARRLAALEETMLALAEVLLRPARGHAD